MTYTLGSLECCGVRDQRFPNRHGGALITVSGSVITSLGADAGGSMAIACVGSTVPGGVVTLLGADAALSLTITCVGSQSIN